MRYKFSGNIPSKKNSLAPCRRTSRLHPNKAYKQFKASFLQQLRQYHPQLIIHLKKARRPIRAALHITRYDNRSFDFDNKIATIQDCLCQDAIISQTNLDDSYHSLLLYPGAVSVDKVNLKSAKDNHFTLEFLDQVILIPLESW